MTAAVALCLISTIVFCIGARGLITLSMGQPVILGFFTRRSTAFAKRMVRGYMIFSVGLLTMLAFAGAVVSYHEIFTAL